MDEQFKGALGCGTIMFLVIVTPAIFGWFLSKFIGDKGYDIADTIAAVVCFIVMVGAIILLIKSKQDEKKRNGK